VPYFITKTGVLKAKIWNCVGIAAFWMSNLSLPEKALYLQQVHGFCDSFFPFGKVSGPFFIRHF